MNANHATVLNTNSKAFDPYHKWLGIREGQTPPNHYRLLGLELWESDQEVIRDAYSRQTNHVKHFLLGPHRDLSQQILNELQAARDTLLDLQLRRPYDRWLQVALQEPSPDGRPNSAPRQPFAVHSAAPSAAGGSSTAETACANCGAENAVSQKFCAACGAALWEPCIECGATCRIGDAHCGACGAGLATALRRHTDEFESLLDQAATLQGQQLYDEAIKVLRTAEQRDHPRLESHRRRAQQMISHMRGEADRLEQLSKTAFADAESLLQQGDFARAAPLLEQLPPRLLTAAMQQLLGTIRDRQVEALTLRTEIQQAITEKNTDGLLGKLDRLLELQPHNGEARQLQSRLRSLEIKKTEARRTKLSELANAEIQRHNYASAAKLLEQIPAEHRTPEIAKVLEKVARRAAESQWLAGDLRDAVIYDEHLLPVAQRLLKLQPGDVAATKFIAALEQQANLTPTQRQASTIAWPRLPAKSQWRFPIDVLRSIKRIAIEPTQTAVLKDPGIYCVAIGLALQGLGQAKLNTNLAPREKRGLLGRLKAKKRTHAWGIDIGRFAIKAVLLTCDSQNGQPRVVNSACIPVPPRSSPTGDPAESIQAALSSFLDQVQLDGSTAVCVGLPAQRILTRLFEIPAVDAKKIPEVMQYEVKQQIPLPLDEVAWDYQVLDSSPKKSASSSLVAHPIALFGAKLEHIQAQIKALADRGIKVDVVQSDGAAVYNLLAYEQFADAATGKNDAAAPTGTIAILDVGADSSNLVIGDGQKVCLRSISVGGNDFTRALGNEFMLNWQDAEKLKRSPIAASQLHQVYAPLQPILQKLADEVQKSIEQYPSQDCERVQQLLVVGDGWKLHGLLKYLCFGR